MFLRRGSLSRNPADLMIPSCRGGTCWKWSMATIESRRISQATMTNSSVARSGGYVPIWRPIAILRASIFIPPFPHEGLNCRQAMWECWTAYSSHTPMYSKYFMLRSLPHALDHLLR